MRKLCGKLLAFSGGAKSPRLATIWMVVPGTRSCEEHSALQYVCRPDNHDAESAVKAHTKLVVESWPSEPPVSELSSSLGAIHAYVRLSHTGCTWRRCCSRCQQLFGRHVACRQHRSKRSQRANKQWSS